MLPEDGTGKQERERDWRKREQSFRPCLLLCVMLMVDGTGLKKREIEWRKRDKTLGRGGCSFEIYLAERLIGYGEKIVKKEIEKAFGHVCYFFLV